MDINTLEAEAFKLLYLWIHQANGRSSTLAELMTLTNMTLHLIVKATADLKKHGLADVHGHLKHSPAELNPNAFNLFPLPSFERSDLPGNLPSQVLVEAREEMQDFLQKKFFSQDAESLRVVVVDDDSDLDQEDLQQRLGAAQKIFGTEPVASGDIWPVREILEAAGIERRRHPGPTMHQRFIAWLVYGYQFKKTDPDKQGIVSPAHFALTRIGLQPGQNYLDIAAAGPLAVLTEMEPYRYPHRWPDILNPAHTNGLSKLLEFYFPENDQDDDE